MNPPPAPASDAGTRIDSLEGLRGLAALVVVGFHALELIAIPDGFRRAIHASPLGLLVNGPAAVHIFFVLSGYVLTVSRQRDRGARDLAGYFVKRVCRIHPPYVAALLVSWLVSFVYLSGPLADADWPRHFAPLHIQPDQLAKALLFPSEAYWQLPVGWSLYVEMAMSLVFPALLVVGLRGHPLFMLALAGWLLTVGSPMPAFARYTIDFALGALLCLERERLSRLVRSRPRLAAVVLPALGIGLLQAPNALAWYQGGRVTLQHTGVQATLISLASGAALFVVLAVHVEAVRRWCSTRPVLFLGRISYSIYLLHLTVLFLAAGLFGGKLQPLPAVGVLGAAAALTIALSAVFERIVEAPSQRLGRAWARRLSPRPPPNP